jgi:peptidoglycan/LPS O-acetylase OafA/YrhL
MLCTFWFEEQWSPQTLYFVPLLGQSLLGVPALLAVFGLTADGGMSVASHVLQHPATQWLGGISYSLYLTHWIVKRLALGAFGAPETPSYPPWMVPPLLAVALPLAWLMTSIVEDPTRKWLCCLTEPDGAATPSGSAWGSYGSAMNFAGDIDTQKQPHQDEGDKL